jgi:3-hydroxybutyryl-CoA dehydratase
MNLHRWSDITVGMKESFEAEFTEEMMRQFAHISGDHNPLHLDREYARKQGYPGTVVFGLMSSSLYSRLVGMYLPGRYVLLQGIDVDFSSPCFINEKLLVDGEVSYMNEAYKRLEIKAKIRKADRKLVSKSTIRVGFHAE